MVVRYEPALGGDVAGLRSLNPTCDFLSIQAGKQHIELYANTNRSVWRTSDES
jgi:hypothetical protein